MSKHKVDVLIIGQGIAGSILGYVLKKAGYSICILDDNLRESSTKVAAGLVSYISGKRLTMSWRAAELIPAALRFYTALEADLSTTFYHPLPSLRIFTTEDERRIFEKKRNLPEFKGLYGELFDTGNELMINAPFGAVELRDSCFLDTSSFLSELTQYFGSDLQHTRVNWKDIEITEDGIHYKEYSAKKLICCSGYNVTETPWFSSLPYRPARGQTLTLEAPHIHQDRIYNFGRWMVPLKNGLFKFGATYEWNDMSPVISNEAKIELLTHFDKHFNTKPIIHNQEVGIRCMVTDLCPIIGFIKTSPSIGIFSGFGSKGVMMVPYFAHQLVETMAGKASIDADVALERFGL